MFLNSKHEFFEILLLREMGLCNCCVEKCLQLFNEFGNAEKMTCGFLIDPCWILRQVTERNLANVLVRRFILAAIISKSNLRKFHKSV